MKNFPFPLLAIAILAWANGGWAAESKKPLIASFLLVPTPKSLGNARTHGSRISDGAKPAQVPSALVPPAPLPEWMRYR